MLDENNLVAAQLKDEQQPLWIRTPYKTLDEWRKAMSVHGGLIFERDKSSPALLVFRLIRREGETMFFGIQASRLPETQKILSEAKTEQLADGFLRGM